MSAATFKFKVLPKRMAKKSEAASYCGLSEKRFAAELPFPPVFIPGGEERFDLQGPFASIVNAASPADVGGLRTQVAMADEYLARLTAALDRADSPRTDGVMPELPAFLDRRPNAAGAA
jgi:hypothetical protein